jgi:hypothetical protein
MSANDRLLAVQSALQQRGVTDVKFCFSLGLAQMANSEVIANVADHLQAYLDNKVAPLADYGDPA